MKLIKSILLLPINWLQRLAANTVMAGQVRHAASWIVGMVSGYLGTEVLAAQEWEDLKMLLTKLLLALAAQLLIQLTSAINKPGKPEVIDAKRL